MKYIDEHHLANTPLDWDGVIGCIRQAVRSLRSKDYAQPLKPYLRFRDMANRIIAMPAYIGGTVNLAGIKWIASFPGNLRFGKARAHSVTILNNPETGEPIAIINTAAISAIRTAAVCGYVIRQLRDRFDGDLLEIGITGFGPIGRMHLRMLSSTFKDRNILVKIFDIRKVSDLPELPENHAVRIVDAWEDAYLDSSLFITCTVSKAAYIDRMPNRKCLILNVSLRDLLPAIVMKSDRIIVDDWDEVCRENTDIERSSVEHALKRESTYDLADLDHPPLLPSFLDAQVISVHPMGMAVFDISVSGHFMRECEKSGNYTDLARGHDSPLRKEDNGGEG